MDLLGSIMSSMDKPPSTTSDAERKRNKERRQHIEKMRQQENRRIVEFKAKIRAKVEEFIRDPIQDKLKMEPMNNVDRALVREITDDAGLTSFSFGQEEVDRHVILWKKESAPGDDEIAVLRRGEEWSEEKGQIIKRKREEMEADKRRKVPKTGPVPRSDYHTKYNHIISLDVGKQAAHDVSANKQYGNVKLENKQDRRTIEETMAERRAKKSSSVPSITESAKAIIDSSSNDNQTPSTSTPSTSETTTDTHTQASCPDKS